MKRYENPVFLAMRKALTPAHEIAKAFGVKVSTVHTWATTAVRKGLSDHQIKVWTDKESDDLKKRWAAGETRSALSKRFGVSEKAILSRVQHVGARRPPAFKEGAFWTEDLIKQLIELDRQGVSDAEICRRLGATQGQVSGVRFRRGVRKGDHGKISSSWSDDDVSLLKRLWARELSNSQIAREMGRTVNSVRSKGVKMGLPSNGYPQGRKTAVDASERAAKVNQQRARKVRVIPMVQKPVEAPEVIPDHARPWLTRMRGECAYPYGPRGQIHSCCKPTFNDGTYCEGHSATCYDYKRAA